MEIPGKRLTTYTGLLLKMLYDLTVHHSVIKKGNGKCKVFLDAWVYGYSGEIIFKFITTSGLYLGIAAGAERSASKVPMGITVLRFFW